MTVSGCTPGRVFVSLSFPPDQGFDDRTLGELSVLSVVWCCVKGRSWVFVPGKWIDGPSHPLLSPLLSHLPASGSLSYFRVSLSPCDTRYTELCPGDVFFTSHSFHPPAERAP